MHGRVLSAIQGPVGVAILGAAVILALILTLRPITPRISFNDGLGYDGQYYAAMVDAMRGKSGPILAERPHYAYRPLPIALVAATGLDVIRGFLLVNLLSMVLAGAFLALIVHRVGGGLFMPAMAVLWWAALPGSLRYSIYYPVLVDGIGLLLLFALVYAVVAKIPGLFVLLVGPAMLARENLIVLLPMLWLALLPRGVLRATAWTGLATTVAAAAILWVRLAPPIAPAQAFDAGFELRQNLDWFLGNANDRALRFASAWILALGLFAAVAIVTWRRTYQFLRRELVWTYYIVATVALIIAIGGDYDRYFLFLVPALAVLTFGSTDALLRHSRTALIATTGVHLLITRFAWPVGTTESAYLRYNVATMEMPDLLALLGAGLALTAAASLVLIATVRRGAPQVDPSAPAGSG